MRVPQGWRTTWGKPDRGPALARAGVPSGVWTRKCRGSASPGACGRSPDAGRAQAIPRHEGASFVSFLPLQQKIGHPPGTRGIRGIPWCSPPPEGIPQARGGHNPFELQSEAGLGHSPGTGVGARCRHCEGVADTDARCRHCEGVVDTVRGSSTPRGGYNARSCQQRASVPTTRVGADNARRCRQRALVPITRVGSYNQRPRRWPSPAPGATVAQAHWHGNLPTPMGIFPLRCGRPDSGGHCRTRDEHIDGGVERPSRRSRQTPNTRPQEGTGSVTSG